MTGAWTIGSDGDRRVGILPESCHLLVTVVVQTARSRICHLLLSSTMVRIYCVCVLFVISDFAAFLVLGFRFVDCLLDLFLLFSSLSLSCFFSSKNPIRYIFDLAPGFLYLRFIFMPRSLWLNRPYFILDNVLIFHNYSGRLCLIFRFFYWNRILRKN